jgi:hypothetical protein
MYYAGGTQVAAILPSSTPSGAGTLTVTLAPLHASGLDYGGVGATVYNTSTVTYQ